MIALNSKTETEINRRKKISVHLFKGKEDVKTLKKIGKARVIAFENYLDPSVTEDLDQYDLDYYHIYLLDEENNEIIGAYRLGYGPELYRLSGIDSFSISNNFDFSERPDLLQNSLELGRAFIIPKHQKNYSHLLLLLNTIYKIYAYNTNITSTIGAVSIPGSFDEESKQMICNYIYKKYQTSEGLLSGSNNYSLQNYHHFESCNELKHALQTRGTYYPVLLRKYFSFNCEVLGFNIDLDFGSSIDVLTFNRKNQIKSQNFKLFTRMSV